MAEFDGVVRVDEIVIRKTQREEKERALLLVTDMFVRERERERERKRENLERLLKKERFE